MWICPDPAGHLQATGIDAAGRKQYLYHPIWRARRDQQKFNEMLDFARALPGLRRQVADDLQGDAVGRERVLAAAVRLLDIGFFRVGGEDYAAERGTRGLATLLRSQVGMSGGTLVFDYPGKSGQRRVHIITDPDIVGVVTTLKRRRAASDRLLAFRDGRHWRDIDADDINGYIKRHTHADFSAKDFRTWSATVLTAVALAVSEQVATSPTARKRAISRAVAETATYLGNTPTVCRASYVHPDIIDRYADGLTVSAVLGELGADTAPGDLAFQGPVEAAVLELLTAPHRRHRRAAA